MQRCGTGGSDVPCSASGSDGDGGSGGNSDWLYSVGLVSRLVCVLAGVQAERCVVNAAQLPQEQEKEDGSGEDVENTVPDHFRGNRNDVSSFRTCPCDRIEQEEEGKVTRGNDVTATKGAASCKGRAGAMPEQYMPIKGLFMSDAVECGTNIPYVEQRHHSEDVITPLIGARYQSGNETCDDKDDAHEESREDVGQRETGGQEKLQ